MPVTTKFKDGIITAYIKGDIDHHTAPGIRESIDDAVLSCGEFKMLVIDFSEVTFMDSSGVGLVMGRYRLVAPMKKELKVDNLSPRDYRIMKMSGIEKIAVINQRKEVL